MSEELFKKYFIKGKNFDYTRKLFIGVDECISPIEYVTRAIEYGLANSVEVNKYNAVINLMHRAGVPIPAKARHLVYNLSDTIAVQEYAFIQGLIHRLAAYYLALSKHYFQKELAANCFLSWHVQNEIYYAFKESTKNRYERFEKIKLLCPSSQILKRIEDEFDAEFIVIGRSLILLSDDFALEVLLINGLPPSPLKQEVTVYRGIKINIDANDIGLWFKYGITGYSDGVFGYHVREPWNKSDGWWEFGGAFVTFNPYTAARFACGIAVENQEYDPLASNILIEIRLPVGSPKVCGSSAGEYELAPNRIDGQNIIAVYNLTFILGVWYRQPTQFFVTEAFYNPYVLKVKSNYQPGDNISLLNDAQVDTYKNLDCKANQIPTLFRDYQDFLASYTPEEYMQAQQALNKNYFEDRSAFEDAVYPVGCNPEIASC